MKYAKNFRDSHRVQRRIGEDVPDEHGYDDKTLSEYVKRGFIDDGNQGKDETKQDGDDDPKKDAESKKPDNTKPAKPNEKKG